MVKVRSDSAYVETVSSFYSDVRHCECHRSCGGGSGGVGLVVHVDPDWRVVHSWYVVNESSPWCHPSLNMGNGIDGIRSVLSYRSHLLRASHLVLLTSS